jgi:metal-responsive CopG/Arc/MetJ family transcriptional regulator
MADTDPRFSLPDALRERVEAAAREEATTPEELIRAALESYLDDRKWQRTLERTVAYGRERAAAVGVTEENLDDKLHEWRRERRASGQSR